MLRGSMYVRAIIFNQLVNLYSIKTDDKNFLLANK